MVAVVVGASVVGGGVVVGGEVATLVGAAVGVAVVDTAPPPQALTTRATIANPLPRRRIRENLAGML